MSRILALTIASTLVLTGLGYNIADAAPLNVVYVTHTPDSMTQYTPFLEGIFGAGNVNSTTGNFVNAHTDGAQQATLEAADLIIIGRQTTSGDYAAVGEPEYWNALNVPILLHSAYLVRANRLYWLTGGQRGLTSDSLDIDAPSDPIMAGVTPVGGEVKIYGASVGYSISSEAGTGILGTIVASDPAAGDNDVVIARWDGTEANYSSSSDKGGPGNRRIFFATPDSNDWLSVHMTADGKQMLTNSINYLVVPEPATMSLLALGGLAILRRRRRC
ncbi:MAG: PEP-CTERM sorting domain-containing protein [Phycisphaerales bacterium]|jgi:hypothetical protein|nr:PEP-CTERM sorting domain-containing protein [Phycisphaerales bacterium]